VGSAAVTADQASLTATKTQETTDAKNLSAAETTACQNEKQQQQNLLAGRNAQFTQEAIQLWSNAATDIWNATAFYREVAHAVLQTVSSTGEVFGPVGFIVGRVGDLANAGLYYEEGNYLQAGLSAITALPLIGSAASLSASEAESVGDGLLQAGSQETAAVDNAIEESTIDRAEQELATGAEGAEQLAESTASAETKCPGGGCFVAGTEVITGYNATTGVFSQTPIQDIQVGDEVLTRNQYDPSGPLEEQTVTATEEHTAYDLREVTIQGADGSTETIQATDEHPFYVEGIGFTGAAQLTVGEQVETANGSFATVVSNTDEPEADGVAVYNFTVGTDHTYFVDQRLLT
jgi:hypothetical protein